MIARRLTTGALISRDEYRDHNHDHNHDHNRDYISDYIGDHIMADCNQVREYVEQLIAVIKIAVIKIMIHRNRDCNQVREYVEQLIVPTVNGAAVALLSELHRFQERLYLKAPDVITSVITISITDVITVVITLVIYFRTRRRRRGRGDTCAV